MAKRSKKPKIRPFGVCPLCQNESFLRDSHIVPLGIFEQVRAGGRPVAASAKRKLFKQVQAGLHEHLLCPTCESDLANNYDKYAIDILRDGRAGVTAETTRDSFVLEGVDSNRLRLFILSVFWRAHHAKLAPLEKVDIGKTAEEDIRLMLRNGSPPPRNSYSVFGLALIDPANNEIRRDFMSSVSKVKRRNEDDSNIFVITFGGVAWHGLLEVDTTEDPNSHLFLDGSSVCLPFQNLMEFEPIKNSLPSVHMANNRFASKKSQK